MRTMPKDNSLVEATSAHAPSTRSHSVVRRLNEQIGRVLTILNLTSPPPQTDFTPRL